MTDEEWDILICWGGVVQRCVWYKRSPYYLAYSIFYRLLIIKSDLFSSASSWADQECNCIGGKLRYVEGWLWSSKLLSKKSKDSEAWFHFVLILILAVVYKAKKKVYLWGGGGEQPASASSPRRVLMGTTKEETRTFCTGAGVAVELEFIWIATQYTQRMVLDFLYTLP